MQVPIISRDPQRLKGIAAGGDVRITRQEWHRLYLAAGNPLP